MVKQEATNTFGEGLVMDLNPLTTPNNVLTNALNATLITYNGNEFVLQNDLGNGKVETAKLPSGFVPLGVKEYGGIIYVASYNPITKKGQIGSFPSPERNLTQDEISDKKLSISKNDFCNGDEIKYYYKRIDVMPEDMYLNPGDKFGLFITGSGYDLLSYYSDSHSKAITFHPAILDNFGNINYIDEECKTNGRYTKGLIFGQDVGDLSSVDRYREAFDKLLVYKGKKSGRLVLIVELETLDDFVVSRSISSNKIVKNVIGSTDVAFSDDDNGEDASFKVTFYNSGWPIQDNNFIEFTGVKFDSNMDSFELVASNDTISYSLDGFKREDILKYKITPYTQLGACEALARTGIINFSLLGTGNIIFTEWRYYVENNTLRINYGLDTNLLEGESVKEVSFEFYDVYYNKVYDNKYICASTINGTYNGNYTEIFNLPYDLNYEDKYSNSLSNKDYIANSVLGIPIQDPNTKKTLEGKFSLKSKELLKNNLYCVKITITTTGLNNEDQSKSFFRFLWTTGYFNSEYIKGDESNFSVLQVPEEFIPKFKLNCEYDTNDSSSFNVNYLNNPTQNRASYPFIYSPKEPSEKSEIKSNLYQDWELTKANIKITTELESSNTIFGDYNPGWFTVSPNSEVVVTYDNNSEVIQTSNGQVNSEVSKYVELKDLELYKYEECPSLSGLTQGNIKTSPETLFNSEYKTLLITAFREGKLTKDQYYSELEYLEELNDTQFYYIEGDSPIEIKSEEGEDISINISDIKGRLIRRLTGDLASPEYTSVTINELKPCLYKNMDASELKNLVAGSSYDANNVLGSSGDAVLFGGDAKGHDNIFAFWGAADGWVDNSITLQNIQDPGNGQGLSYNTVRKELSNNAGHCVIYPAQSSNYSDVSDDDFGALGVGFYTEDSTGTGPYNTSFMDYFYEEGTRTYTFKSVGAPPIVTITLWRTSDSSETDTRFGAINLGATGGYSSYITSCLIPLLKAIHILHKNVNRELYIEKLIRMIYHGVFPTKINIGVEIDFDPETQSSQTINITKSPIKLYEGDFTKDVVSERLQSIGWSIEEDKWYKSVEDLSGGKEVLQCSYLNIPYGKILSVDSNNVETRADIGPGFVNLDLSNLTKLENNKYILGCTLDLGGQMDMSIIVDTFNSYLDGSSTYKPTFIYVPNGDSFDLIEGVDSLGNTLTNTQVYYLGSNGEYVAGNSSEANNVDIFGHKKHCKMKELFIPMSLNGYLVPVLNISAAGTRIEKLSTNISNGGNRKHVSDINYYRDVYFTNNSYTPLLV